MPRGNPEQLNSFNKMTPEQRRELGRQGGIKSGETKRRKKAMKDILGVLLDMPIKPGKAADMEAIKNFAALKGKNITVSEAILIAQLQKALQGNVQSAEFIRDTSGQKPVEDINMTGSLDMVQIIDDIPDTEDEDEYDDTE